MQTDGIKIDKHFPKNLGQYFMDWFGSDGTVVKGLNLKLSFEVPRSAWQGASRLYLSLARRMSV